MKQEPRSSQDLHERSRRWLMDDDTTGPETSTSPRAQVAAHNLHKQTDKTHRLRAISKPLPKTSAQAILEPAALTPEKVPVHRTVPASARAINRSPKKQLFIDNFGATKGTLSSEQTQKTASVTLINDLRSLARVETKGSSFTQTKPAAVVKCKKVSRWRFLVLDPLY